MVHRDPWEQQDGESAALFNAFSTYRNFGLKRKLRMVADELNISINTVQRWSSEWGWRERVTAWDREMDREARERLKLEQGVTAARHFDVANKMLDLVEMKVDDLFADDKWKSLQPRDVKEWLAVLTPIQRLSMDMATHINENREGEAQDANDTLRALLANPDAAQKVAELGEMVVSEHTRPESTQPRAAGTHLYVVESDQPGDETE